MNGIGGFLDFELNRSSNETYHNTTALSTGRACFKFILQNLKPSHVHLPFFVCDALLQPLYELKIPFTYYKLNEKFEFKKKLLLTSEDDLLVYVNYFAQKSDYIQHLAEEYQKNLIIDDTQAFFQKGYEGVWSFNSVRKFIGVPDGAYLYGPKKMETYGLKHAEPSWDHLINRSAGNLQKGYEQFKEYEAALTTDIMLMSKLSEKILKQIDYKRIAEHRRNNYQYLNNELGDLNLLKPFTENEGIPLYYPFLYTDSLHNTLAKSKIFVPHIWPEILSRKNHAFRWENHLAENLMPLPIDQRYNTDDMKRIVFNIK